MSNTTARPRVTVAALQAELARIQAENEARHVSLLESLPGLLAKAVEGVAPVAPSEGKAPRKATTRKAQKATAPTVTVAAVKVPRTVSEDAPAEAPRLKAFTRADRKAFMAAALSEGVDFREEVTGEGGKTHLQGWTSNEIVTYCLANDYCPAGWRIADGWKARVAAK